MDNVVAFQMLISCPHWFGSYVASLIGLTPKDNYLFLFPKAAPVGINLKLPFNVFGKESSLCPRCKHTSI